MRSKNSLILAILVFVVGTAFAIWSLWGGASLRGAHVPKPVDAAPSSAAIDDKAVLDGARFVVPGEDLPIAEVVDESMRQASLSVGALLPGDQLSAGRARALLGVAGDRLSLYLDPSWDAYVSQVRSLTGKEPSISREEFESASTSYRGLPVDPEGVRIQARYRRGESRQLLGNGHELSRKNTDGTYYSSDMLYDSVIKKKGIDVYDLSIPMQIPDLLYPPEEFEAFLVLSFYWNDARGRWLPWQTVIRDPSPDDSSAGPPRRMTSPPWL